MTKHAHPESCTVSCIEGAPHAAMHSITGGKPDHGHEDVSHGLDSLVWREVQFRAAIAAAVSGPTG